MADKLILVNLNLNGNVLKNVAVESLAAAPASPVTGQFYLNSTDGKFYYYNGTAWVAGAEYSASNKSSAAGTIPVLDGQVGNDFQFKVLQGSGNLNITESNGIITFSIDESDMSVSTAVQNAIDTAKADAISTAASDATSKADAAEAAAKSYADGLIDALDSSVAASSTAPAAPATPAIAGAYVITGVTQTDGELASKTEVAVDAWGSAAKALADAEAYADGLLAGLDSSVAATSSAPSAPATPAIAGAYVLTGVTQTDGELASKTEVAVDAWGSAAKALADAEAYADGLIAGLDASDSAVAHQFLTAVSETDGVITVTRAQPKAEDIAVDALDGIAAGDLQTVLGALEDAIDAGGTGSIVDVEKQQTAESGYAATYVVKQGGSQVGVKINIPKDYLVKSASVETVTVADQPYSGAHVGDKYIDFVVNTVDTSETATHIYLPVNDLVDVYTAGDGLALSNSNEFSIDIDSNSEAFLSIDGTSHKLKLSGVQTAINNAIAALDADLDASGTAQHGGVFVVSGVTEVDGVLTAVDSVEVEAAGAAADALSDAEAYADGLIAALDADLDASGTAQHGGVFVMSGVTEVDGVITSVDSVEVEQAGAAAAAETAAKGYADGLKNTVDAYTVNGVAISDSPVISVNVAQAKLQSQSSGVQVTTPVPGSIKAFYQGNEVDVAIAYNGTVATVTWNGSYSLDIYYLATAATVSAAAAV